MGGIERALVVLSNYFVNEGFKVNFISCLNRHHFYVLDPRISFKEPPFKRTGRFLNKEIYYLRVGFFIRRTVKEIKPDGILSFGDEFNPLVLISLLGFKYPVFISDRTSPDFKFKFPIKLLKLWLYPKSAGFIAQTMRAARYKNVIFGDRLRVRVIPNALRDVALYPGLPRERIILYVGRLSWEKAPERLLKAFSNIPDRQGWTLHIAGSGPLSNEMKQLALELNINDSVAFYGKVPEIDKLYAKAGIYVLPSLLEGFPNSLCEAMAAGLPCICFDSIPYEEIFTNGVDGIAIDSGDLDKLTSAMIELMNDKQLRETLGTRAKQIRNRLSVDIIGKQFTEFIFGE